MGEGPFGALLAVLEESRARGFLGPGPIEPHVERALAALPLIPGGVRTGLDLGSGGGLPGLPLALARPDIAWVLLDGSTTRCGFLREAIEQLELADRVAVVEARAETAGRDPAHRGAFDVVVTRSFGAPAVTAECGAPFLRSGGHLIVAEPPEQVDRWPADPLGVLGLVPVRRVSQPTSFQILRQESPCPLRYPRRTGVPAKRPLF